MLTEIRDDLNIFNVRVRNNYVLLVEDHRDKLERLIRLIDLSGVPINKSSFKIVFLNMR